eukprot:gene8158-11041_t
MVLKSYVSSFETNNNKYDRKVFPKSFPSNKRRPSDLRLRSSRQTNDDWSDSKNSNDEDSSFSNPIRRKEINRDHYTQFDKPRRNFRGKYEGSSNQNNIGQRNYYEEKKEPEYGSYDGDHIYGVSAVRLAIVNPKRTIKELLLQSGMELSNKKDEKTASEIVKIAKELNIPIREFSKHDLNMLTENRPHQGFVLRASPIEFIKLDYLEPSTHFRCVLALDEVWDPQNFGALLRTSHFLGCDKVVVCAKNSAPLSPTVSKASSGSLEVMDVYSTNQMMKFLDKSIANGWQVIGTDLSENSKSLFDIPLDKPTILVLGNEGHGIRTNVLRKCTHLIKITAQSMEQRPDGINHVNSLVDSLNVSVTGGIILHHFLTNNNK